MNISYYHISRRSKNDKTGPILVTTSSRLTCPDSCIFKRQPGDKTIKCYADQHGMVFHWDKVTKGERGYIWPRFIAHLTAVLEPGEVWRHNQAGDLPKDRRDPEAICREQVVQLAEVTTATQSECFTYTAYDFTRPDNLETIKLANTYPGMTINVSAKSIAEADHAVSLGLPVAMALPKEANPKYGGPKSFKTTAGNRVTICPATYKDELTCVGCKFLCQRKNRDCIIGFPAHGQGAKNVDLVLNLREERMK